MGIVVMTYSKCMTCYFAIQITNSYIFKYVGVRFLSYRIKMFAPLTDKDISKRSQRLYSIAESIEILIIECIHARFQVMDCFIEYVDALKKIYFQVRKSL